MPASDVYSLLQRKETAHDDPIYCCKWAKVNTTGNPKDPSKDYIVTGGLDCSIKVWLFENNKLELIHTLKGHYLAVVSIAVSPDGHTIASTSLDSRLMIWDLISGQKVYDIPVEATDTWQVAFSPDGNYIVSGSHKGKLTIYGLEKGTTEKVLDTRGKFAMSVAWSVQGDYIASGSEDGTVYIFDVYQGKLIHTIEAHSLPIRGIDFSHNSKFVATASNDGNVKIYSVGSATLQATLDHKCWALGVSFSPDGTRVATAAADGTVRVAVANGLKVANTFKEHTDTVWGVQFNAEGNKLVSISKDKCINIYECPVPPKKNK